MRDVVVHFGLECMTGLTTDICACVRGLCVRANRIVCMCMRDRLEHLVAIELEMRISVDCFAHMICFPRSLSMYW